MVTYSVFNSILFISLFLALIKYGNAESKDEDDFILSLSEKKALERFKEIITPYLEQDYMKKDIYLIRWLRAKDFKIDEAIHMLKENLKWRKEENIDNIDNEDWSYFEQEYPIFINVYDLDGRPTMVNNIGEWDVRKAAISGNGEKLTRWLLKAFENLEKEVRNLQSQGKNVTRWNILYNLDKFSAPSICLQCLSIYTGMAKFLEVDYPNGASKLWAINSPGVLNVVLNSIRPILSPGSNAAVKAFGTNKAQWESILLEHFDKNQLPFRFGGRRIVQQIDH